jgi:flagellin FlaB
MEKRYMERLKGKYCKIVTKEPGEDRATVVTGTLEDVDYKDGFILIDSSQGLGCLRISTIIAIKPGLKRRIEKRKISNDEQAIVGIGTLIVFIAMVLVAAVAASVIIQTAESLQQRAYAVGKQTTREVSSGVKIIDLTGYTDENKTRIEYLAISVKPRAGSYDIDINETLVYVELDNLTVLSLNYINNDTVLRNASSDGVFHTLNHSNLNATNFGVIAIRDADNSVVRNYGMSRNDLVMIIVNLSAAFTTTSGLPAGQEFMGRMVPEVGAEGIFLVSAPNAFDHRVIQL